MEAHSPPDVSHRQVTATRRLASHILLAMLAGAAAGYAIHSISDTPAGAQRVADMLSIVTDVFLRLIKMIIAPLVFTTLVAGIAHMGDAAAVGRVGRQDDRLVHAGLARLADHRPGHGAPAAAGRRPDLPLPEAQRGRRRSRRRSPSRTSSPTWFPRSIFEAMAQQRDPADRRVLGLRRHGGRLAGRQGAKAARPGRAGVATSC